MIPRWIGAVAGIASAAVLGCADDGGPRLDSATPPAAGVGALVTLEGRRFCGERGDCVTAGGAIRIGLDQPVQASILMYSNTSAQIRIPSITPIGRTSLVLTVNDKASNALDFEVLAP